MSYALLGQSCQTSMSILVDNRKFFPLDNSDYGMVYTKMQRYPAEGSEIQAISENVKRPEDIKIGDSQPPQQEEYKNNYNYKNTCCGNK